MKGIANVVSQNLCYRSDSATKLIHLLQGLRWSTQAWSGCLEAPRSSFLTLGIERDYLAPFKRKGAQGRDNWAEVIDFAVTEQGKVSTNTTAGITERA